MATDGYYRPYRPAIVAETYRRDPPTHLLLFAVRLLYVCVCWHVRHFIYTLVGMITFCVERPEVFRW